MAKITTSAGNPYGHVPGHNYIDADLVSTPKKCKITITWGSSQGYDEEHGREEYTRTGRDQADAIAKCRDAALAEQNGESRRYIETAASRALEALYPDEEASA